jgi:hypothetical protein
MHSGNNPTKEIQMGKKKKGKQVAPVAASQGRGRRFNPSGDVGTSNLGVVQATALANKLTNDAGGVTTGTGGGLTASDGGTSEAAARLKKKKKKGSRLGEGAKETLIGALANEKEIVKSTGKTLGA